MRLLYHTVLYDYDAFGNLQGDYSTPGLDTNYLYTGQQYDVVSELYSLRARYYDASIGRFLSRDTWAYDFGNPVELNRYVYTANNPATWSDPTGYFTSTLTQVFTGGRSAPATYYLGSNVKVLVAVVVIAVLIVNMVVNAPPSVEEWDNVADDVQEWLDERWWNGEPPQGPNHPAWKKAVALLLATALAVSPAASVVKEVVEGGERLMYITYTLTNPTTGKVYSGRTRGYGDPDAVVRDRYAGHHKRAEGYRNPTLDKWLYATLPVYTRWLDSSYQAIRGREQQLIDFHGGAARHGGTSGNDIRGVAADNWLGRTYHKAASARFGELHVYTGN